MNMIFGISIWKTTSVQILVQNLPLKVWKFHCQVKTSTRKMFARTVLPIDHQAEATCRKKNETNKFPPVSYHLSVLRLENIFQATNSVYKIYGENRRKIGDNRFSFFAYLVRCMVRCLCPYFKTKKECVGLYYRNLSNLFYIFRVVLVNTSSWFF